MGELILISGPPGAGKSTVAALVADQLKISALVPGDEFFGFLRSSAIEPWLARADEQNSAVIEAAASAAGRLARYCDVVYDGVIGPWFVSTFIERAEADHVHYAVLLPPLEVCLDRVRTRSGHGFSDIDAAEHMWREFRRTRIDERHEFNDPTAAPAQLVEEITERMHDGGIRFPHA